MPIPKQIGAPNTTPDADPIAIIGMACRLPGGNNSPDDYWSFLLNKGNGISEVPKDRWDAESFYDENPDAIAKSVSKWAGFLDDIRGFDAQFFGISPREAASMDPQQRLLLQCTYEAMQDSNTPAAEFSKIKTGVFVGISQSDYRTIQETRPTNPESFAGTGYALCINANRVSHRFNLTGPSYAVDTACSSSLVALNQAVQNLRSGACDVAAVAGVNVLAHPSSFIAFSRAGMLSNTGKISTFDENANGFVRGEAIGVVLLKPLSKALADGDNVQAVIHASVANQDGFTSTITAPNQDSQVAMLEELFVQSGIEKEKIGFVEAHGTGTPIGDPIEAGAIGSVIGQHHSDGPVFVGSGKANVGHSESAAGISGLIKAVLAVKNGVVPPNVNFKSANPYIPFDALNLKVPTEPENFPDSDGVRYAVVNSFGFGGTNASALISSAPNTTNVPTANDQDRTENEFPHMIPVSGTSRDGMLANAADILEQIAPKNGPMGSVGLGDLAAALGCDRSHLGHRAVILARTKPELKKALQILISDDEEALEGAPNIVTGQVLTENSLCFMFAGQGSQWWGMSRNLLEHNKVYREAVEAYDAPFRKVAGWSILEELLKDEESSRIDDTTVTQPALFAIQSGLAALWATFGIKPDMVVGHSIGEAAASYVAGGLSLDGAASFLSKRGAIRDQLGAKGAMAAIGLGQEDVQALLPDHGLIGIAAINGPGSTTISGDYDAIHAFVEDFQMRTPDTFIRLLKVDTAWHSYQLEAGEAWFRKEVSEIDWSVPNVPFVSTVTGSLETRFDIEYGWSNLRQPVNFKAGIETALKLGAATFLELGPHATLAGPATSTAMEAGARVQVLSSISRKESDFDAFARTAAKLFVSGYDLDWVGITGGSSNIVELPKNHWMEEDLWQDSEESRKQLLEPFSHPFLGVQSNHASKSWWSEINLKAYPFLKDHRMQSDTIFPGAGYIDVMIALGNKLFGDKPLEIENSTILDALFVPDDRDVLLSTTYSDDRGKVSLYSRPRDSKEDWVVRSEGKIRVTNVPAPKGPKFDPEAKAFKEIDLALVYDVDASQGFINYGDAFQVIDKLWMSRTKTVAKISMPDAAKLGKDCFFAHPSMLDGCLQITDPRMTLGRIFKGRVPGDPVYLPVGARRIRFYAPFTNEIMVHATLAMKDNDRDSEARFVVTDMDNNVLMTADGLQMRALPTKAEADEEEGVQAHFVRQTYSELRDDAQIEIDENAQGHWVVTTQDAASVSSLVTSMEGQGAKVSVVLRETLGESMISGLEDQFGDAFETGQIAGLVFANALTKSVLDAKASSADLLAPIERSVKDLISVGDMMDFCRTAEAGLPRICVLTSGAFPDPVTGDASFASLTQAPVLAVTRVLATETPEYTVRHFDFDTLDAGNADKIALRMLSSSDESEIILRDGKTFGPRLQATDPDDFDPKLLTVLDNDPDINFHATMRTPGVIDDLGLWEIPLVPLADDQVRVKIAAVGLNFRDIMAVTGLLPVEAEPDPAWQHLGLEFGAVVHAVGKNVKGFKAGDRVMGLERRCLQRFMNADPRTLTLLPDHISLEEAATIPSAFATAHYALNRVGHMKKGEKVFIHVATGGVGMAAVQLAQDKDVEIFATAGSPKKRKILKDLGVHHIMDSRTLKFADDVERITKGEGVDVLLNSLPGDYISKGLDIVAPYGRYLEIGKVDVYADSSIGMKALRKNVSFSVLDLAAMGQERPDLLAEMFAELVEGFEARKLKPLPLTTFPISKISDAVRYMSQARHVGKVVVTLDEPTYSVRRDSNRPVALAKDASYMVTGGTRGFSLTIADWMSRAGAGKLYLTSRSGTIAPEDAPKIALMEKRGTMIEALSLDVTDGVAVQKFIVKTAKDKKHPIRGVVHGAAVIKDGFANQLTPEMIDDVLRPKILGGWNLHKAFEKAKVDPDFLVGFSSIAQVIGSGGQSNYVAANAFLEALAQYRHTMGKEGSAINWGAMAESGFVARSEGLSNYLDSVGLLGLTDDETDGGMELALSRDVSSFVYSKADWPQIARANTALGKSPRIAPLLHTEGGGSHEVRARLMSLQGEELRAEAIEFIKDEICNVLKIEKSTIQTDRPMSELGLDSLSSFELKMRVETALDFSLPVSRFLQAPSVDELGIVLEEEIGEMIAAEAEAAERGEGGETQSGEVDAKSKKTTRGSDRQFGLLGLSHAVMTSPLGVRSLELSSSAQAVEGMSFKDLKKAVKKVAKRHPFLHLRKGGANDGQQIWFDGDGPTVTKKPNTDPLNVAMGEYARVSLQDGTLTVCLHQGIGDQASADIFLKEVMTVLAGDDLPKRAPRRAVQKALANYIYDGDSPVGHNDRSFWWYTLKSGASQVPFNRRTRALVPSHLGRDRGPAEAIYGDLPSGTTEAALLMAFAEILRDATKSAGNVLVNRISSSRDAVQAKDIIGPFKIEQPVMVETTLPKPLAMARLKRILDNAVSHVSFDSYAAADEFATNLKEWNGHLFQIAIAHCSAAEFKQPVAAASFDVVLEVCGDQFRLVRDADVVPIEMAEQICATLANKAVGTD